MDQKTKLYVFDRKEVFLIFLFMILISLTSFTFGVKIGKTYTDKDDGFIQEDRDTIEMESDVEEKYLSDKTKRLDGLDKKNIEDSYKNLEKEFNQLDERKEVSTKKEENAFVNPSKSNTTIDESQVQTVDRSAYAGKYTIQLGSHQSQDEAMKFADGFKVRGYTPIINEVKIEGKGIWFRVSLGIFETVQSAKDYIDKEQSLFQGQDYVIGKLE